MIDNFDLKEFDCVTFCVDYVYSDYYYFFFVDIWIHKE